MLKIDMSPEAVTRRLKQAEELRKLCLSLAQTSIGLEIMEKHKDHPTVSRTAKAIGRSVKTS